MKNMKERKVTRIYFLLAKTCNVVKIGLTARYDARLKDIQGMSPEPLVLLKIIHGAKIDEMYLHNLFSHLRRPHGEWFEATDDLLAFIKKLPGC